VSQYINDRMVLLVERLRRAGVPVGMSELVDGFDATACIGIAQRNIWRSALRSCLIKRAEHLTIYDDLFDRLFPLTSSRLDLGIEFDFDPGDESNDAPWATNTGTGTSGPKPPLQERLLHAVSANDADALQMLAAEGVDEFAGIGVGGSSEKQYMMRAMRALDLANLLQRALRESRKRLAENTDTTGMNVGLTRTEIRANVETFRTLVQREITRRLAELEPVETITTVKYPDDAAFLEASVTQRNEIRRIVKPLAQKLAARMAQRRRLRSTGRVDVRRTARRSLAFGGVPLEPKFKSKRASKPDLVVICDVSGSVSDFAHFILALTHGLHEELHRLRTFVFVDGIAEVTQIFADAEHELEPMHLLSQPGVVTGDGHSDYGAAFERFLHDHKSVIRPSTTVIICGDARSNYRDPKTSALRQLSELARAVYWINPEQQSLWATTDSVVDEYRPHCTQMFEVSTARQLAAAVLEIDAAAR
jgi:uncharacterized protein